MESKRIDDDEKFMGVDAASRGAAMALADNRDAAETKARAKLAADRGNERLMNWGVPFTDYRTGRDPRPACTYRGARRNAARAKHWPARRRYRLEPRFT